MNIKKISDYIYEIKKTDEMRSDVRIFADKELLENIKKDNSIKQAINVSKLPGIYKSIMMPDAHQGYGFCIGGVAAFDIENGIITPGGIGFDINCGVRLLTTDLPYEMISNKINDILEEIFKRVPSGVGTDSNIKLSDKDINNVLKYGSEWAIKKGYGINEDLENTEESGRLKENDPNLVSQRAKARGKKQLGTLGSGNHFLEIQLVDKIYDNNIADKFGLKENNVTIMIHCGSRGLGHQVCSDYLKKMEDEFPNIISKLPERDLIYAPIKSNIAQDYLKAMNCAANFAWANRQLITHNVRQGLKKFFPKIKVSLLYDVAHNIAKIEEHKINNETKKVIVHRKGATRAFPKYNKNIPAKYREIGQPVIIPGSMGTSSYVLIGTEKSMEVSFGSSAHGAGRVMSRLKANKSFDADEVKRELEKRNIRILSASKRGISEEAPQVYKDIDKVIKITEGAGISRVIARLIPIGVIKG